MLKHINKIWKSTIVQEFVGIVLTFTAWGVLLLSAWFIEDIRRSIRL
jgi:hypothetical protein